MDRTQFTFYDSFAQAGKRIKKAADRCAFYDAIIDYALHETLPDLDKLADAAALGFMLVKPNLDASRRKASNGKRGGEAESKTEANDKQTESKPEASTKQGESESKKEDKKEGEDKKEDKKEKEKENECSISPPTPSELFSGDLLSAVNDWLSYKRERREAYKPTGLRNLFSQLRKAADEHGEAAVVDVIRASMASGYQGVVLDRLKSPAYKPPTGNKVQASCKNFPDVTYEQLQKIRNKI